MASVVGSMDDQGAQYAARCMIQPKTREDTLLVCVDTVTNAKEGVCNTLGCQQCAACC